MSFSGYYIWRYMISIYLLLLLLLITRWCLIFPLHSVFSLAINNMEMGRYFWTMQISCSLSKFPPKFSIYLYFLLLSWWYNMMIFHFQHCFHIYHLVFYCKQEPFLLSCFFFFLINKGSWIISPTLIYNSSNYFSAHIVLVIVHGSSPFKLVYVCYMPLFKGTSLLSGIT